MKQNISIDSYDQHELESYKYDFLYLDKGNQLPLGYQKLF